MKRKWVLLSTVLILFLFMFYIAFKSIFLQAYVLSTEVDKLSWLTQGLRHLNLIAEESDYVVNPVMVTNLLILIVAVFITYYVFALFMDAWLNITGGEENSEQSLFDQNIYKKDNQLLSTELSKSQNLVIAIDEVSLFLNVDLLQICSKNHFILLTKDIIDRFQQATELVKSPEMKSRYEQVLEDLTENTSIRSKIIYYQGSEEIMNKYDLDTSYATDKFIASCLSAVTEDDLKIKVVSRNESIIFKAKQFGFSTFKLKNLLEEHEEVNVWDTKENHGIVH